MSTEREAFEAWIKDYLGPLTTNIEKSAMWAAWRARAGAVEPAPELAAAPAQPAKMSPEFTDTARAALLWVLWHHQGGSSPVGQPLRFALGMGAHDFLSEHQIDAAKRWGALTKSTTADFHRAPAQPAPQGEPVAEPPLIGRWHHGNGYLCSGSLRIAHADFDTNPPRAFQDSVFQWIVDTLNAAVNRYEASAPDEFATPPAPQGEPVATLHDDGCFTWKRDEYRLKYDRQRAGWRMDVYATPQAPQDEPVVQSFGIIDPDYARIFTQTRILAWQYGYACLAHGSFTRDLDLLLVPWTDAAQADDVDYFAPRIADAAGLKVSTHPPSVKSHGRKTWTLLFPGFADPRWVDLSVLAPVATQLTAQEQKHG